MTDLLSQPRRVSRRRIRAIVPIVGGILVLATLGGLLWVRNAMSEAAPTGLTVVVVEPAASTPAEQRADLGAEVREAQGRQDQLMLAVVAGGDADIVLSDTFACGDDANELVCENEGDDTSARVAEKLDDLVSADRPAEVDLFAPFRALSQQLSAQPVDGEVSVFLNVSGRHDVPGVELASAGLGDRLDEVAAEVEESRAFPEQCDGWSVHLVMPASGDAAADAGVADLLERLLGGCGGELASVSPRWLGDVESTALGDYDVEVARAPESVTYSLGSALFDTGSAELRPDALEAVDAIVADLADSRVSSLDVVGYADSTGDPTTNLDLSQQRADAVAGHLRQALELADGAVHTEGRGALPDDGSAEAKQGNRRVDVVVTTVT